MPDTQKRNYTSAFTNVLVREAAGSVLPAGLAHATAWAETAAGAWARAGMAAKITGGAPAAISPALLAMIFRDLVTVGESLHLIVVTDGEPRLFPVGDCEIMGKTYDESGWMYRVTLDGPSGSSTTEVASDSVLHCRYSVDRRRPWRGIGPIARAGETSDLLSNLSVRMKQESGASSAIVIPSDMNPDGFDSDDEGDDRPDPSEQLALDLGAAKGGLMISKTMGQGIDSPQGDYKQVRIGSEIRESYGPLLDRVGMAVATAMGLPPGLIYSQADGTNQREAWRRFAHGSVGPVARIVGQEIEAKLDTGPLVWDLSDLYASDIVGRSSAFKRLVDSGMPLQDAASVSGILTGDD